MGSETDFDSEDVGIENIKIAPSPDKIKKHACPFAGCGFSFNRPWKLNRHINTHTKQRPFKCDFPGCTKDYTNQSHLDRHKCVSHSKNKPTPVQIFCPYPGCTKVFMNKWSLKRHCNIHENKETYDCTQCGVSFKKFKQLKQHLNVHLNVKPFVCDTCKDTFETQKELRAHKKKHKIYTCEYQECQQQFKTWNANRKHMKACHFTLFNCDTCGKSFKKKWQLSEHISSHLPEDSRDVFSCPYNDCQRFYFYLRNLEHHLKSFHENINHKCEVEGCDQTFVKKSALKKHQKLTHSGLKITKIPSFREKKLRKPRKDKGKPRKSMAAMLSGIILPYQVDKNLAQSNITSEILEEIENLKNAFYEENTLSEKEKVQS